MAPLELRRPAAGFEGHLRLAQGTVEVFDDYRADGMDFEMHDQGLLMAFTDKKNLDHHLGNLDLVRQFDLDPQVLLGDAVRNHEPKLTDAVHGGIYFPLERHLDPGALVRALHKRISELGVQIEENAPIDGSRSATGGRVTAGTSDSARTRVVLAAGAWTGPVSTLFGTPLPVRPGKGYSVDVAPYGLRGAVNLSDAKVAVTPLDNRLRLAGTMEFGGLDETINQVRVDAIMRAPGIYFRDWEPPADPSAARAGCRPMTPDGKPIIGRLGDLTNAYVSAGHGMLGVTLAPGTAAALTDLILRDRLSPDLNTFSPARSSAGRDALTALIGRLPPVSLLPGSEKSSTMSVQLRGILAAVTTPFTADGSAIDEPVIQTQVERLVAAGIHGLVPTGTTGEFMTLNPTEYRRVVELYVAGRRRPGARRRRRRRAVHQGRGRAGPHFEQLGADAIMIVPPFYDPLDFPP